MSLAPEGGGWEAGSPWDHQLHLEVPCPGELGEVTPSLAKPPFFWKNQS